MFQDRWHIPTSEAEIVGVFLIETEDLIERIGSQLKLLMQDREDRQSLTDIRRYFHTLKGSGRMVKALDLSEFAWKIEKALNQALSNTEPVSEPLVQLLSDAHRRLPGLITAFKLQGPTARSAEIQPLLKLADELADGRKKPPSPLSALDARLARAPAANDLSLRIDHCMQRADEALHRSELALHQVRHLAGAGSAPPDVECQRGCPAEIERLSGLVKTLSSEVADLRRAAKNAQAEPAMTWSEIERRVDARARYALSSAQLRSRVPQHADGLGRAEPARQRSGWRSLLLGALIGGFFAAALLLLMPPSCENRTQEFFSKSQQ